MRLKSTTLLLLGCFPLLLLSQIRFNEVMNWNTTFDAGQGYDDHCDWIEFQTETEIDLAGWTLSDDPQNPQRWTFPEGIKLSENQYLVVFADGFDISLHANFKLKANGEWIGIFNPDGNLVDSLSVPFIGRNYAYGRSIETDQWGWYDEPTPGRANDSVWYYGFAERPVFSHLPAFYQSNQTITIDHPDPQATIRYTYKGETVTEESPIHASPINLSSTEVIRARAFKEGYLPSETVARTFFVYETVPTIPVISITTDPANLWDNQIGIYVTGTNGIKDNGPASDPPRNWNQPWERESNFEYLDTEENLALEQTVGIKVFGGWSRAFAQKSLSVFARKQYGENRFHYPFFDQKDFSQYKSFILRNSGNDWSGANGSMIRDAFQQALSVGRMEIDHQAYQPISVYLNGEYWGIHNQREKLNENYLYNNHLVNEDELDLLKNFREAFNGNVLQYNRMMDFVNGHPMSFRQNYLGAKELIDMQEYMDYMILQIYINNQDWPGNNIKYWRAHAPGSRWRWLLYDTDFGFGIWNSQPSENTMDFALEQYGPGWPNPPWATELFRALSASPEFRTEFSQRYLSHINYSFTPERVDHILDSLEQNVSTAMVQHMARWGGQHSSWQYQVDVMRSFGRSRPTYARQHLRREFNLGREINMRLWWPDGQGGSVLEQEYKLKDGSVGTYFSDLPLNLLAMPDRGYEFSGWELFPWSSDSVPPAENAKLSGQARFAQRLDSSRIIRPAFVPLEVKFASLALGDSGQSTQIGIYNPTDQLQHLNGYRLLGDTDTTLASGSSIEPNGWLWLDLPLNTDTFSLVLKHAFGNTVDSLYFDRGYWPGVQHYQLKHPQLNNADASNWRPAQPEVILAWQPWIASLKINEVQAANLNGIKDENKQAADWLEIYNPSDRLIDLGGMYLSDDLADPYRWQIPMSDAFQTTILSKGFLRFWADGDTADGILHLPFKLAKAGETLYLFERGGLLLDSLAFPALGQDSVYARFPDGGEDGYIIPLVTSTPAGPNRLDNARPTFTSEPLREARPEQTYRYEFSIKDPNGDQIWQEALALPRWAFYNPSFIGGGNIFGTPSKADIGEHLVVLRAWDGYTQSYTIQSFTIEVLDPARERVLSIPPTEGILFPNPNAGLFTYMAVYDAGSELQLKVFDVAGRVAWERNYRTESEIWQEEINLTSLSEGIYFLQVWEGESLKDLHKIVIQ
ncbi:MAG: CotH kinase family protein [Bacteroidota bacterium]